MTTLDLLRYVWPPVFDEQGSCFLLATFFPAEVPDGEIRVIIGQVVFDVSQPFPWSMTGQYWKTYQPIELIEE